MIFMSISLWQHSTAFGLVVQGSYGLGHKVHGDVLLTAEVRNERRETLESAVET